MQSPRTTRQCVFGINELQQPKYAVCKHGQGHNAKCGFAHSLAEIGMPFKMRQAMWYCRANESRGHAGIDMFFGQQYTAAQHDRVLQMINSEGLARIPKWARMFSYFVGYGSENEYVCDNDFGLYAQLKKNSELIFKKEWSRIEPKVHDGTLEYPFPLALDEKQRTLAERMRVRMASAVVFPIMRAVCDWNDLGNWYAGQTSMHWGPHSQQYLPIKQGNTYYLIGASVDPTWYFVCEELKELLQGGWCPPTAFRSTSISRIAHDVTLPVLEAQRQPYVSPPSRPPPIRIGRVLDVCSDGSWNPDVDAMGAGIAAGCIAGSDDATCRVSFAGVFAGAEIAELLGIILLLQYLYTKFQADTLNGRSAKFETILIRIDSQNAQDHVFNSQRPAMDSGKYLLPAISLAKRLVARFTDAGIWVCPRHTSSKNNPAHRIAKHEQEARRRVRWGPPDVWPDFMPAVWQNVLIDVAKNQAARVLHIDDIDVDVLMTL